LSTAVILESLPAGSGTATGLHRKRVYIFLTRQGFMFVLLLMVMLLGAVNYVNSMAYLMTFLLGSLFMVCMLHTYRNLRGLVVRCSDAEPVFAGEQARFPILFDNRDGAERTALRVRTAAARPPRGTHGGGAVKSLDFSLVADEPGRRQFVVPALQRGTLRMERLIIETRYPLGLFRAWSYLDGPSCTVYPRPGGGYTLPPSQELETDRDSGLRPGSDDFAGFADYRPGDSIRRIDWRALAREQGLLVKRFSGSGGRRLILSWVLLPDALPVEARLSQLCRWVLEAERQDFHYALELPGTGIGAGIGVEHRRACLEALAHFGRPAVMPSRPGDA
jgi:uncharacterized protein (DUF58 family)